MPESRQRKVEQREFPGYICIVCGAWDSGSPGPRRAPWCDGACSHPKQEMEPIVFVRKQERDAFQRCLFTLAGMCPPHIMERYRARVRSERERAAQGKCDHEWEYLEREPGDVYTGYCERCVKCDEIVQVVQ